MVRQMAEMPECYPARMTNTRTHLCLSVGRRLETPEFGGFIADKRRYLYKSMHVLGTINNQDFHVFIIVNVLIVRKSKRNGITRKPANGSYRNFRYCK